VNQAEATLENYSGTVVHKDQLAAHFAHGWLAKISSHPPLLTLLPSIPLRLLTVLVCCLFCYAQTLVSYQKTQHS